MIDSDLRTQLGRLPAADAVDHPPVRKALMTLEKARREHDQAQEAENTATAALEAAKVADRHALAAAMRADKPDPQAAGPQAVAELDAARLRVEAAAVNVAEAFTAVVGAVEAHRGDWLEALAERRAGEHQRIAGAIGELEQAVGAWLAASGMMSWVRAFPDGKLAAGRVTVDGLVSPNGEDYAIGAVTAGLRTFLERVDVKPEPAAVEA